MPSQIRPATQSGSNARELNNAKSFGDTAVLKGLDLLVPRGKITFLIGRSGTGKSVTIKHVMSLLRPDEGRIFVDLSLGLVLFDLGRRMDLKWMKRDWTIAACGFAEAEDAMQQVLDLAPQEDDGDVAVQPEG